MDAIYMEKAITLACLGQGKVNPNPLVGAVIVKNGQIIGEGYHMNYGEAHAEVNAINSSKEKLDGSTIYVTLEPCSHYGKTPPCVEKIIESKISKVVIGMVDPNPIVAGNGINRLRDAGIEVVVGVLEEKCKQINEVFIKYILTKEPYILLKTAMTLDGKIATKTGESKYITSEKSRERVHKIRNAMSGIMVGINTVIKDDPQLTTRIENGRNPYRIIVDSKLRIPLTAKIIENNKDNKTIIATTANANSKKVEILKEKGIRVLYISPKDGQVDLRELVKELGKLNIDGILLEGGAQLNFSALNTGIVDKIMVFIAPKIIGGNESKTPVEGTGVNLLKDSFNIEKIQVETIEQDIVIEGYIKVGER